MRQELRDTRPPLLGIGFAAWNAEYVKSTLELFSELARYYQILYVEYPYTITDVLRGVIERKGRPVERIIGLQPRIRQITPSHGHSLHVLTLPPIIPVNWAQSYTTYAKLAAWNANLANRYISHYLKQFQFAKPVYINAFNPFLGLFLKDKLKVQSSIYYCYDEIGAARWAGKHGKRLENEFLPHTDMLICSSEPLLQGRIHLQDNAYTIKNGVHYDRFYEALALREKRNKEKYILGYLGSIDDRIDLDLLEYMLNTLSNIELLLVGPIRDQVKDHTLFSHESVIIAGPQPAKKLPFWAARMDMGLIPFIRNEFTQGIYPMKVNEYLAAGLPVLSTDFGDLSDFEGIINIAQNKDEFLTIVNERIEAAPLEERLSFANANSWQERGRQFHHLITQQHQISVA